MKSCPSGGIGRRKGFKIPRLSGRASSSLASGTILKQLKCGNSSVGRARPCQGRGREFEPRFPLHFKICPSGGIGRRKGFKIPRLSGRASSSLASGTILKQLKCGNSSVGRARPCQGRGREFEPRFPLHFLQ